MRKIVLVVHNVRSAHNVGSLLRTADAFAVERVYLSGYTPYPASAGDSRLPHVQQRLSHRIQKTALGAEKPGRWEYLRSPEKLLQDLSKGDWRILALEQTPSAENLIKFKPTGNIVLVIGSEIGGIEPKLLKLADKHLQIPMLGDKDSLNVATATGVALYHLRFIA